MNLTGQFLVAMPALIDSPFSQSVILICHHDQDGAMGIMINRPTDITCATLFNKLDLPIAHLRMAHSPVLYGGPVQPERGFVIHPVSPDDAWHSSYCVKPTVALTSSKDILQAISEGQGPQSIILALGYSGWHAGQLEDEMSQNVWLSVEVDSVQKLDNILYISPHKSRLSAVLALLGIQSTHLSAISGHA